MGQRRGVEEMGRILIDLVFYDSRVHDDQTDDTGVDPAVGRDRRDSGLSNVVHLRSGVEAQSASSNRHGRPGASPLRRS